MSNLEFERHMWHPLRARLNARMARSFWSIYVEHVYSPYTEVYTS